MKNHSGAVNPHNVVAGSTQPSQEDVLKRAEYLARRLAAIVEGSDDAIISKDLNGIIESWNPGAERIFGYSDGEMIGKPMALLIPADRAGEEEAILGKLRRGERVDHFETERLRKDKRRIFISATISPIIDMDGQIIGASNVARDITERRNAEVLLQQKNEELEQFAYRTSHDLRSPLLSVGQLSDLIIEDICGKDYEEALSNIHKIKKLTDRLRELIEDILALTKSNYIDEPADEFNFSAAMAAVQDKFGVEAKDAGVEFRCSFKHQRPLLVQTVRLAQVLDNFISNAIKYRDPEKPFRFIEVRTHNDTKNIILEIQDNGVGIPKDRYPEVFGMFKRFHATSVHGSGLGLYIVRKHLDKLGADVHFESSPAGTTFYVKFPLARV